MYHRAMRCTAARALVLCLLSAACSNHRPPGGGDVRAARAALTLPPTPQGVDAPVFGPALDATDAAAAFDGTQFLVVWEDGRRPYSDIVAARVGADGTLIDPENLLLPASTPSTAERFNPTVTYGAGAFLVAWE